MGSSINMRGMAMRTARRGFTIPEFTAAIAMFLALLGGLYYLDKHTGEHLRSAGGRIVGRFVERASEVEAPAASADEPKVDLRGPAPTVGQTFRSVSKFELKDAEMVMTGEGRRVSAKMTLKGNTEHEARILALDQRAVTKYQLKVIKDEKEMAMRIGDEKLSNDDIGVLSGEVIVSTKEGGKWKHELKSGKPTKEQAEELNSLSSWDDEDDIPEGRHEIGHTWEVDAAHLKRLMGNDVTAVSGKLNATVIRLEKYSGELCAVVEYRGRVKCKITIDDNPLIVDMDLTRTCYRSLNRGCTLLVRESGPITIKGQMKIDGVDVTAEISGTAVEETTIEVKN